MTVQVVLVVAMSPAVRVWEDERVRTSISGETGCLPLWIMELYPRLTPTHEKNKTKQKVDGAQTDLQGLQASEF